MLAATALVASGASALNQWLERDYDAKMRRTQGLPLPSGRLQADGGDAFRRRVATPGLVYLDAGGEFAHQRRRRGHPRHPVHLHAAEARDMAEHRRRSDARRFAA